MKNRGQDCAEINRQFEWRSYRGGAAISCAHYTARLQGSVTADRNRSFIKDWRNPDEFWTVIFSHHVVARACLQEVHRAALSAPSEIPAPKSDALPPTGSA